MIERERAKNFARACEILELSREGEIEELRNRLNKEIAGVSAGGEVACLNPSLLPKSGIIPGTTGSTGERK